MKFGSSLNPQPSTLNPLVVIKVGGSLFDRPDLAERLTTLIMQRPGNRPLLIAGGGAAADAVRSWGRTFSLSESACHRLALESMNLTATLLAGVLPDGWLIHTEREAAACWSRGACPILDVSAWLDESEANRTALPESWDVTSDSLSAWVAARWSADELWLLKSTGLPAGMTLAAASQEGLVDAYFPQIAPQVLGISWCNLRADRPTLQRWQPE